MVFKNKIKKKFLADYIFCFIKCLKQQYIKLKPNLHSIIVTWFYIGRAPIMPGTFGSLAAYPIYYYIILSSNSNYEIQMLLYIIVTILCILGFFAIHEFQKESKTHDHKSIVIDEVIGQLLTLAISYNWLYKIGLSLFYCTKIMPHILAFIIGLIIFRFFDIKKPFFIKSADAYFKNAFGVIFDDILAAFFASGTIFIIFYLLEL